MPEIARTYQTASYASDVVSVKDFGAVGDGVADDTAAIQAALDAHSSVYFPDGDYLVSSAIQPNTNNVLYFDQAKIVAANFITGDDTPLKLDTVNNVRIYNPHIDCGSFAGNSGIIIRDDAYDIQIYNVKVDNAVRDVTVGGGRGVIVESPSEAITYSNVIIDGLITNNVNNPICVNSYEAGNKNTTLITNAVCYNSERLITVYSDSTNYPHGGDSISGLICNVVGYDVTTPIRFDRASNFSIDNVRIVNTSPITDAVVRGVASNMRITNVVLEGDAKSLVDGTPYADDGTTPVYVLDSEHNHYDVTLRGTASDAAITAGVTRTTLFTNCTFSLEVDDITTNLVGGTQVQGNNTAFADIYVRDLNAKASGFLTTFGSRTLARTTGRSGFTFDFTPTIIGTSAAGTASYSTQWGRAVVENNICHFDIHLAWSSHTGTGNMRIDALPFSSETASGAYTSVTIGYLTGVTMTASNYAQAVIQSNSDQIQLLQTPVGGGSLSTITVDAAGTIMVSGSYPL